MLQQGSDISMSEIERIHVLNCFGCNLGNPIGLKANFTVKDDCVLGEFQSNENHIGPPPDIVHGGVIAAIIDESFSILPWALFKQDIRTIKEEITFRNPAKVGDKIYVETRLEEQKSRTIVLESKVYTDRNVIAEARGTLLKMKEKK